MSCEMLAVEEPVPRRALVVAPRPDNVEVDAVDPVRELRLFGGAAASSARLDCRFILCPVTRPKGGDPARKKTTDHGDATTKARNATKVSDIGFGFSVQHELDDLDFSRSQKQRVAAYGRLMSHTRPPRRLMFAPWSNNSRTRSM